ncbi:MAG: universal stress protein [Solirubrobacteraceae bacterium]
MEEPVAPNAIISYDDTLNDQDALALGNVLADAGAELTLVYVRHTTQSERTREELEEHEAQALLGRGARLLGDLEVERRIVVSGSTGEGIRRLAEQEETEIVVFGSDYRTAAGHVAPQRSTQTLLEGGSAAVAIAPGNYRTHRESTIRTIGVLTGNDGDHAATETAHSLAERLDATVVDTVHGVDLLVVGSRAEAPAGQVMITSRVQNAIEAATAPVLVVPRGVPVHFPAAIYVS